MIAREITEAEALDSGGTKEGLTIDGATGIATPTPPKIDLASALDIRREMAKVYRETKAGKIDTADGAKLVYMLAQVGKMIELHEVETRLAALEERQHGKLLAPVGKN